jgi:hypothetical protein
LAAQKAQPDRFAGDGKRRLDEICQTPGALTRHASRNNRLRALHMTSVPVIGMLAGLMLLMVIVAAATRLMPHGTAAETDSTTRCVRH